MVAELEESQPIAGNGSTPSEPPSSPPLTGEEPTAPAHGEPAGSSESVAPPSTPPAQVAQPAAATHQPPQAPVLPITPMPPPPGWYGDIFGNSPRWWDGTIWTEHVLVPLPAPEPVATAAVVAEDEIELSFIDEALISFSLAPDWAKFLAAAVVTAVLALIGLGLLNGDSASDDVPDGFVPQTPELGQEAIPGAPETPVPTEPDGSIER